MGNDDFGGNRGGRNDFFGDAYRKTSQVSVSGRPSARENPPRQAPQRGAGGALYGRGAGQGGAHGGRKAKRRGLSVAAAIFIDVLLAAVLLGIFYITNYEMNAETDPIESLPVPSWLSNPTPSDSPSGVTATAPVSGPTQTDAATADPNDWRTKFSGMFTDGAVEQTENTYKSKNINITINKEIRDGVPYFIADIYIAELKYFRTAFAKNPDKMGERELTDKVAKENNAILAINGDHCVDNAGTVIRNGKLYRKPKSSFDVLVMNYDGSMQTFSPDKFDLDKTLAEGVYQVWSFGPMLLHNGKAMNDFNLPKTIGGMNPRTAVGYYEPGHYCFVQIGGRQQGYSLGCTIQQLSQLFADLGCKVAYNLDGGQSSEIIFINKMLNQQAGGRRSTTDILYIGE